MNESLMHHFKLYTEGFSVPAGECTSQVHFDHPFQLETWCMGKPLYGARMVLQKARELYYTLLAQGRHAVLQEAECKEP